MTLCFNKFNWSPWECLTRDQAWYDYALLGGIIVIAILIILAIWYFYFRK